MEVSVGSLTQLLYGSENLIIDRVQRNQILDPVLHHAALQICVCKDSAEWDRAASGLEEEAEGVKFGLMPLVLM